MAFNTTLEGTEGLVHTFKVEVPETWVQEEELKASSELAKVVTLKGFRKGKVPPKVVKSYFSDAVMHSVLEAALQVIEAEDVKNMGFLCLSDPRVTDLQREKDKGLVLSVMISLLPKSDVPDFSQWTLEKYIYPITEEDVARKIQEIRERLTQFKEIEDRGSEMGDVLVADLQRLEAGVPVVGEKSSDPVALFLGSDELGPGTDQQLLGMKKGDERVAAVTVNGEAGTPTRRIEHMVRVKTVYLKVLPEMTPSFFAAATNGMVSNEESFNELIKAHLGREALERQMSELRSQVRDRLDKDSPFQPPESVIDRQEESIKTELSPEQVSQMTEEDQTSLRIAAARRVKVFLLLDAIASDASVVATEEEVDQVLAPRGEAGRGKKNREPSEEARQGARQMIIQAKVYDHILSKVAMQEVPMKSFDSVLSKETG